MKIGMLMLGDLHFFSKHEKDSISGRFKNDFIYDRIKNLLKLLDGQLRNIKDLIIIVNGDITNRAKDIEYSSAYYYINKIRSFLIEKSITPYFVFSPGNHDVNLTNSKFDENKMKNYYYFINRFVDYCEVEKTIYYDIYTIKNFGTNINFISINPFSNIETINDLNSKNYLIDSNAIKNNISISKKEVNIVLSHIPLVWYDRNNTNNYSFLEEQNFTIYSHEHNETKIIVDNNKVSISLNCFSEETRKNVCGVILGCFDTVTTVLNLQTFNYFSEGFILCSNNEVCLTDFFGYDNSKYKVYKNSYDKFMNEEISTLCGKNVDFLNIFAEPKFYVTNDNEYEQGKTNIKNLKELMVSPNYCVVVTGGKSGGKTSVLKYIFSEELKNAKCPVYVKITHNNVVNGIEDKIKSFIKQNYVNTFEEIKSSNDVILLIDDFNLIQNPEDLVNLKDTLQYVSKVYITSNDEYLSIKLSLLANEIEIFKIQPFGYESRYKMINNWVQNQYDVVLDNRKNSINEQINTLMNNISLDISLSPELVLIFLNAYESKETEELINSSKIIYYKYLITKYIVNVCEKVTFTNKNLVEFFYSELAYYCFKNPNRNIQEFHNYFLSNYVILPEEYYSNLKHLKNNIFFAIDSEEMFKLSFFKAYFISKYYKMNIGKKEVEDEFFSLIDSVFENNLYVNIILFFLHDNSHNEYMNRCVDNMKKIFEGEKLFDFDNDIKIFNSFIKDVKNEVKKEGDVINNNILLYKKLDEKIEKKDKKQEKNDLELILIAANNYLEICSEVLPLIGKKEIVFNILSNMIDLSLRMLSNFVELSKILVIQCENDKQFDYIFYSSLAIISAMLNDISTKISSTFLNIDVLNSYNLKSTECIKRKIELILLRKNDNDSNKLIDSVINYKEKLLKEKNYIAGVFLLINIDIELNYIGAYNNRNTNVLIEKTNKYALSYVNKNPLIEMNNVTNRRNIRKKKFKKSSSN